MNHPVKHDSDSFFWQIDEYYLLEMLYFTNRFDTFGIKYF